MFAPSAKRDRIVFPPAGSELERFLHVGSGAPRYMWDLVWEFAEDSFSCAVGNTFFCPPIPNVPPQELSNPVVLNTISSHPHLFKIVTPINVDEFENLTRGHPNQALIQSVVKGLHEDKTQAQFMRDQRDDEICQERYSKSFGVDLLPGMYNIPVHAILKPPFNSGKLHLVIDMSAGQYAPNSLIPCEAITGLHLDGMHELGSALIVFCTKNPMVELVLFKSDVSQAYQRLPMHPTWQIKEIMTIDGERHVNCCNDFGGRGSFNIWAAFFGLVNWIVIYVVMIKSLMFYVDDDYSFEVKGNVLLYEPYGHYLPEKQTKLLLLWDQLGLPHEEKKQIYGTSLTIIGFEVDPNAMMVTLPVESLALLLEYIRNFIRPSGRGNQRTLKEFQKLAGYINWCFNVFPLLKPGLCAVYEKIVGKTKSRQGVHFLSTRAWGPDHPDVLVGYVDASGVGLGFWFPTLAIGFQTSLPGHAPKETIFYFEALTVCSTLHYAAEVKPSPTKVVIYTDNTNTMSMFDSLWAHSRYNHVLMSLVDILLDAAIELHVPHITSTEKRKPWKHAQLRHERAIALGYALDPSTRINYTSVLNSYITFCKLHDFPIEPSTETFSFYVTYMSAHIEPWSVNSYLSSISSQMEPFFPHIRDARNSPLVAKTMCGCKQHFSKPLRQAEPLTLANLTMLIHLLGPSLSHNNLLFLTITLTGFYGLLWVGEMVWPDTKAAQLYKKVATHDLVSLTSTSYSFTVPK
ncbi:hypothetical protein JAAARDRAFT_198293 [Jaapia argillacea MUCL 33604]|uniref:Reverse transcriptase domain-containing protein n=1 Tax=Jaapia argillacea MUCL 33604 TaxID=933084 RepID=A0A067PEV4_9AGAM|nr:hypothetical protein JAAARDRAFT_198293 [Jaapia argillacea MUCL 33604]